MFTFIISYMATLKSFVVLKKKPVINWKKTNSSQDDIAYNAQEYEMFMVGVVLHME